MSTAGERARTFFRSQAQRLTADAGPVSLDRERAILKSWEAMSKYGVSRTAAAGQVRGLVVASRAELQEAVYETVQAFAPSVTAAFDRHFLPFAEHAIRRWPVKTGASKRLLNVSMSFDAGLMEATFGSPAPYTFMIKWGKNKTPKGFRRGASVWWSLVRHPHGKMAAAMAKQIEEANR